MNALSGGFSYPAVDAARGFRALLEAMARPGTVQRVGGAQPPAPVSVAAGVALLTLADADTPLHLAGVLDTPMLRDWIGFHIGAPLVGAEEARFALGLWSDLQPVTRFAIGEAEYPDRSATLIVEMPELHNDGARLTGPGIEHSMRLNLPETAAFVTNRALFPLGFDCIFTCGDQLAALPRSTRVEDR